jgi:4-alpha-glucanotransferase
MATVALHPISRLQAYANSRGVGLVGDMPIYVGGQSADVWAHRDLFELQPDGTPALVRWGLGGGVGGGL